MAIIHKLIFAFALIISANAQAFKIPVVPGAPVAGSATKGFTTDGYMAFTGGNTTGSLVGSVAGKSFTLDAVYSLGGTAAGVALGAIRATPLGFVGSVAITSWLASSGVSIENGALVKANNTPVESLGTYWVGGFNDGQFSGPDAACTANIAHDRYAYAVSSSFIQWSSTTSGMCMGTITGYPGINGTWAYGQVTSTGACRDGYIASQGACIRPYSPTPATEEDLAALKNAPLPDAVATEATQKGVKLPLSNPTAQPKRVATSDPYTDPKTGQRYRDEVQITPQPSNPGEVDAQPIKRPLSDTDSPDTTETGEEKAPEEEKDPCKVNPEASACQKLDELDAPDLENRDINLSIIPLPGFGPSTANCPASKTLFNKGGQPIVWEWTRYCEFSLGIRPLVIGFAWIAAFMLVAGVARRES